ncbi:MAG TPA: GerMN domain-containing protein [Desulfuromonadaceae bacterium]
MSSGRRKRSNINLLIPFLVVALVFGMLIWQKYRASRAVPPKPHVVQPSGARTAVLFFVTDGNRLGREARELGPCDGTAACVKDVLDELFSGPVGELDEALPEGAAFNGLQVTGDTAVIDLNRTFVDELPRNGSAEMLAVYSIVDTVCANFPQITLVRLTIEGAAGARLHHLDLSQPLRPDYSLEREPAAGETGAAIPPSRPTKGTP